MKKPTTYISYTVTEQKKAAKEGLEITVLSP